MQTNFVKTDTVLDKILAHKVDEVAARQTEMPLCDVVSRAADTDTPRDFAVALRRDHVAVIAEVKKASPSKGVLVEDFDPVRIGTAYAQNEKNLQRYEARVAAGELPLQRGHALSTTDMRIRGHIWNLLAGRPAVPAADELSSPWWQASRASVERLVQDGLLEMRDATLAVTERGRAFLPAIAAALDHYAQHAALAASSRPRAAAGT